MTPEDVKFSIDRFADPKVNVNYATLGSAIDEGGRGRRSHGQGDPEQHRRRLPGHHGDVRGCDRAEEGGRGGSATSDFAESPVGSGPFMVAEFKRGRADRARGATRTTGVRASHISTRSVFEFMPRREHAHARELSRARSTWPTGFRTSRSTAARDRRSQRWRSPTRSSGTRCSSTTSRRRWTRSRSARPSAYATPKEQILRRDPVRQRAGSSNSQIPRVKYWDESIRAYPTTSTRPRS